MKIDVYRSGSTEHALPFHDVRVMLHSEAV
jgi:hypothetical protein